MPDLLTHLATSYVAAWPAWERRGTRLLFFAGVMLPDLLTRSVYIPLSGWRHGVGDLVLPLHTPLGHMLVCLGVTQLFAQRRLRKTAFWAMLAGGVFHFLLDGLQRHVGPNYCWLFPFSFASTEWGLFWPEAPLRWLPLSLAAVLGTEALLWGHARARLRAARTQDGRGMK